MSFLSLLKSRFRDPSLWTLVFANVFTIVIAQLEKWDFVTTLWVYLGQSLAIGLVGVGRILVGETQTEYGRGALNGVARFLENCFSASVFLLHYGGFHLVFVLLLRDFFGFPAAQDRLWLLVGTAAFLLHHSFSFLYHRWWNRSADTTPVHPYTRILPMHLTLVLFPLVRNVGLLFLGIRALVDVGMHLHEHRLDHSKK